jgi:hypothetical protein
VSAVSRESGNCSEPLLLVVIGRPLQDLDHRIDELFIAPSPPVLWQVVESAGRSDRFTSLVRGVWGRARARSARPRPVARLNLLCGQ